MVDGKTQETYEALSANEASQLVREGWILQSIRKRNEEGGKPRLVYYMTRPRWYEPRPKPASAAPSLNAQRACAGSEVERPGKESPLAFFVRWMRAQLNRAATME